MAEKMKMTPGQIGVFVALMCMYFIGPMHSAVNVASQELMNVYGVDANAVSYMVSITNLLEIPAALVIGLVAGRKLSYRVCALLATALVVVGGAPAILGAALPWWGIMATRCILGLGLGCFMPIVMGVISLMFQKESVRATMMSIASVCFNVGMIVLTSVAGILGAISWNLAWAIYLIALIPFVLCIFLLNPKNVPAVPQEDEKGEKVKIQLPVPGWVLLVLFLGTIIMSQSLFNLGGVSIGAVVDNPAVIGTVFSLFSVGAIGAAVLFGPAYKFISAYTLPVFWIVGIVGYILWFVAHVTGNVPLFYVAIILAGFGTNTMTIGVPMLLSTFVAPAIVGAVMGFSYVFQNGGGFLASPIDQAILAVFGTNEILSAVWIFNVILGIVLLLGMFWVAGRAKKLAEKKAPEPTPVEQA
ncbi:MFS transporter [Adlercreutzia sp. ZJ154]|uniref:MFS transporter n=1 Tax=Adlercreutzia sp. ZJ154 TaxID=2709790 RepID=UPI0013EBF611|nr:MFS transporter [Adlercreutzia sp. ZJ154]